MGMLQFSVLSNLFPSRIVIVLLRILYSDVCSDSTIIPSPVDYDGVFLYSVITRWRPSHTAVWTRHPAQTHTLGHGEP